MTEGAQVVERVSRLLKLIAADTEGTSTPSLVERTGLTRPTVHRLLSSLADEGLVDRASGARNWVLGPENAKDLSASVPPGPSPT